MIDRYRSRDVPILSLYKFQKLQQSRFCFACSEMDFLSYIHMPPFPRRVVLSARHMNVLHTAPTSTPGLEDSSQGACRMHAVQYP
jgi:hypothetical protein